MNVEEDLIKDRWRNKSTTYQPIMARELNMNEGMEEGDLIPSVVITVGGKYMVSDDKME